MEYPSTNLLLIRHCDARDAGGSYGTDSHLSELGRRQAALLAKSFATPKQPLTVYTSPWPRATQTAGAICHMLGTVAIEEPRLAEFQLVGYPFSAEQMRPDLVVWRADHSGADGETLADFGVRVASFCNEVAEKHVGHSVLVVTHSGAIDAAVRWAIGLDPASPWLLDLNVATGSVTELRVWPHGRADGGAPRWQPPARPSCPGSRPRPL